MERADNDWYGCIRTWIYKLDCTRPVRRVLPARNHAGRRADLIIIPTQSERVRSMSAFSTVYANKPQRWYTVDAVIESWKKVLLLENGARVKKIRAIGKLEDVDSCTRFANITSAGFTSWAISRVQIHSHFWFWRTLYQTLTRLERKEKVQEFHFFPFIIYLYNDVTLIIRVFLLL